MLKEKDSVKHHFEILRTYKMLFTTLVIQEYDNCIAAYICTL